MKILEVLFFIFLTLAAAALVIYLRIREQRYLKKKTSEAFSPKLKKEIEEEKLEEMRKSEKFQAELKRFS